MYGIIAPDLLSWLVQQAPVVVVMGAAIYWLATKLNKAEGDKDSLAKDVIVKLKIVLVKLKDVLINLF